MKWFDTITLVSETKTQIDWDLSRSIKVSWLQLWIRRRRGRRMAETDEIVIPPEVGIKSSYCHHIKPSYYHHIISYQQYIISRSLRMKPSVKNVNKFWSVLLSYGVDSWLKIKSWNITKSTLVTAQLYKIVFLFNPFEVLLSHSQERSTFMDPIFIGLVAFWWTSKYSPWFKATLQFFQSIYVINLISKKRQCKFSFQNISFIPRTFG